MNNVDLENNPLVSIIIPLYNGEKFTEKSQITMVIAGRPEAAFVEYKQKLFNYLDSLNISWKYIGDIVRSVRSES